MVDSAPRTPSLPGAAAQAAAPAPPDDQGPSERGRRNVKLVLLELLATDADVHAALAQAVAQVLATQPTLLAPVLASAPAPAPAPAALLGDTHAEHAQNVVDLIETRMQQLLRPDAFRKPAFIRTT